MTVDVYRHFDADGDLQPDFVLIRYMEPMQAASFTGASLVDTTTARGLDAWAPQRLLRIVAGDIDAVLSELGAARVEPGALALRDLAGIDTAVVARLDDHRAILTPHGGPAITDALLRALERAGAPADHDERVEDEFCRFKFHMSHFN